ncbi:MAG: type II toxin-antitoxin system RelE/ParE family toxin [Actinomycetota bacterium]
MTRVELAAAAVEDLDALIATHSLPGDTRQRVRRSLAQLEQFPRLGPELSGRWTRMRFILGPWRWMLIVYSFDESKDRAVVVTIQDSRSSRAAATTR